MRARIASGLALIAALSLCGCDHIRACRDGTIFLSLTYDASVQTADHVELHISIGGGAALVRPIAFPPPAAEGTVEIAFSSSYPAGQAVTIEVVATRKNAIVGTGFVTTPALSAGCTALSVTVGLEGPDLGAGVDGDGGSATCLADPAGGMILVDDHFDSLGVAPWSKAIQGPGASVELVTTGGRNGSSAVHFHVDNVPKDGGALARLTMHPGPLSSNLFVRAYVRLKGVGAEDVQFLSAFSSDLSSGLWLSASSTTVTQHVDIVDAQDTDASVGSSQSIALSITDDTWRCFEWQLFSTQSTNAPRTGEARAYLGCDALALDSTALPPVNLATLAIGIAVSPKAGAEGPIDAYYDDVIISTTRVGCD